MADLPIPLREIRLLQQILLRLRRLSTNTKDAFQRTEEKSQKTARSRSVENLNKPITPTDGATAFLDQKLGEEKHSVEWHIVQARILCDFIRKECGLKEEMEENNSLVLLSKEIRLLEEGKDGQDQEDPESMGSLKRTLSSARSILEKKFLSLKQFP